MATVDVYAETPVSPPLNRPDGSNAVAPQRERRSGRRLPFQLVAAIWIGFLLCVITATLTLESYRGALRLLRATAAESTRYVGESLSEKVGRILAPAENALNLLAASNLSEAGDTGMRLRELPDFLRLLTSNTGFDAAYIGYVNGEFLLIRPLRTEEDHGRYAAPKAAALLVQSISRDELGAGHGQYRFYGADGTLLRARAEPGYNFDPRERPWFQAAQDANRTILTDPYVYFTTNTLGVTMARPVRDGGPVIGIDLMLQSIAAELTPLRITPATEIAVIDRFGRVIGYPDSGRLIVNNPDGSPRLAGIQELGVPALAQAALLTTDDRRQAETTIDGRGWQLLRADIRGLNEQPLGVLIAVPNDELFADAYALLGRQLIMAGIILVAALGLGFWASGLLARPLRDLARKTRNIAAFDFTGDMKVPTRIAEIGRLGGALQSMQETIRRFLDIGHAMSTETDLRRLLARVLRETMKLVDGDGGVLYLRSADGKSLEPELALWGDRDLADGDQGPNPIALDGDVPEEIDRALKGEVALLRKQHMDAGRLATLGLTPLGGLLESSRAGLIVAPLTDRQGRPLGVLLLLRRVGANDSPRPIGARQREFVRAISGSAGIAIENKLLLDAQKH
ncbi:MAG TPA: cache domain-containing protein, partial [Dongiaceae bacterium]|nr:cache domain-containing protein [Dongiaceae bacterium]